MMKFFCILLCFLSFNLTAQPIIKGKVLDKETKKPIDGVLIQNITQAQNLIFSDNLGHFSISVRQGDSILFSCLGYQQMIVTGKQLSKSSVLSMEPETFLLNEVNISYDDANKLLQQSIYNLKKKLLCNKPIPYLWHGYQSEDCSANKREGHAIYTANLLSISPDKKKIPFQFSLIELNHMSSVDMTSKVMDKEILRIKFHLSQLDMASINNLFHVVQAYSEDSSKIVIKCRPKQLKKGEKERGASLMTYYIQKKDSVFLAGHIYGIDSLIQLGKYSNHRTFKYKMTQYQAFFSFQSFGNFYYLDQDYCKMKLSFLFKGKEEVIESIQTATALLDTTIATPKNPQKLNGFVNQLFELKNTTNDDFWTKHLKLKTSN